MYDYSITIYKTWSNGNDLEKNLIERLIIKWYNELEYKLFTSYSATKDSNNRLEFSEFKKLWIIDNQNI
jgi:hypothetical protein